ncbi:MAG: hypothetical protein ACRDTJ_33900, partial [Pseudonocardiaceae bacterium]
GGAAFGPSSGGRAEAGGAAARNRAGLGVRPGAGGDGIPGRGAPGRDGPVERPATPGPRRAGVSAAGVSAAGVSGTWASGGSRADAGSFLQPPVGGRGNADDTEHRDRYAQQADHIIGKLPLVAPAVIGETSAEEHRSRGRDGR